MKNENRNEEAVSPVIATILMVAITVVLAGVLYVWASSLAEGNTDGDLTLYDISAVDAGSDVTTGTDDELVRITMNQGSDINWAAVKISISVDGAAPITCTVPGSSDSGQCAAVEFGETGDNSWSVGDGVTITESGQDLCSSGTCSIEITIVDTQAETTIDTSTAVAQ